MFLSGSMLHEYAWCPVDDFARMVWSKELNVAAIDFADIAWVGRTPCAFAGGRDDQLIHENRFFRGADREGCKC